MSTKSMAKKQLKLVSQKQFAEYIKGLAWSSDGNRLAIISAGGELALWQEDKFKVLKSEDGYSLDCVGFSADGKWLATGGQKGEVAIWRLAADTHFELTATLDWGTAWIDTLAWHPQQNWLAFAVNRHIEVWNANTGDIIATLDYKASSVFKLAWHPQKELLAASGHGGVKVWHSDDWSEKPYLLQVPGASLDCAWSEDGKYLASGNLDRTISLLDWGYPPPWLMQGFPGKISRVTWSRGNSQESNSQPILAASCQEGIIVWQWDSKDRNWQNHVLQHSQTVRAIAFSPDSSLLASAGDDDCIKLWQKGTKLIQTIKTSDRLSYLAWHPTGKYLAAGGQNGELTLWQSSNSSKGFGNR